MLCAINTVGVELSIRIRKLRKERGWTIAQLAERVGVSQPHMSEVERGKKNLNNHLLVRIADALKVKPHELIVTGTVPTQEEYKDLIGRLTPENRAHLVAVAEALLAAQEDN